MSLFVQCDSRYLPHYLIARNPHPSPTHSGNKMPMRIRLALHGTRNNRIFHLVAIDQRKSRNAKPAELLGIYNPTLKLGQDHKKVEWSVDRIKYWLGVGALPSKTAVKLLEKVIQVHFSRFIDANDCRRAKLFRRTPNIIPKLLVRKPRHKSGVAIHHTSRVPVH